MSTPRVWILVVAASAAVSSSASAVIVNGGDGTQNTTGEGAQGWEHVGTVRGASAVYLGNQWVLTAVHVGPGDLFLPGRGFYSVVPGSSVTLVDPVTSVPTDMTMFRISSDPGLPTLNIPTASPSLNTTLFMTGFGRNRAPNLSYWSVNSADPENPIWTQLGSSSGASRSGFFLAPGNTKRWGTNNVNNFPGTPVTPGVIDAGLGPIRVISTSFSNLSGEGQGASGDSGGGAFDAGGRLVGMLNAIGTFINQPADTVVIGQLTYVADLSQYRNQLLLRTNVIPEPASAMALLPALALLARRR